MPSPDNPTCILAVFAKPPLPGRTKLRLAKKIGHEKTAALSSAMLYDILCEAKELTDAKVILFYSPDACVSDFNDSIPNRKIFFEVQKGKCLGKRLKFHLQVLMLIMLKTLINWQISYKKILEKRLH